MLKKMPEIKLQSKPSSLSFGVSREMRAKFNAQSKLVSMKEKEKEKDPARYEIEILDNIGMDYWTGEGTTAKSIKDHLKEANGKDVLVYVNSPGGDAFEGVAIYNLLREYKGEVTMRILGMAASAASVIVMAGDKIEIGDGANIMIHSAWGVVVGNRNDMREFADMLDKLDESIAAVYAQRTGRKTDELLQMMADETWMFGQEAIDEKFADSMIKSSSKASLSALPVVRASSAAIRESRSTAPQMSVAAPGATGKTQSNHFKGTTSMKPIAQQIADFEATRATNANRMNVIMSAAAEAGRTLDDAETQEYDRLKVENKAIDAHLERLRDHEKSVLASASALDTGSLGAGTTVIAPRLPADGGNIVSVKSNAPKGIAFARYVKAIAMAKGNIMQAAQIAQANKQWMDQTPQVQKVLMAAVAGGDTLTSGWASELVYNQDLVAEFLEILRPQTIIGKMTGMRQVPFNVRMGGASSGGTGYWVGQGAAIPASKMQTTSLSLGIAKAAGLMVITDELARSSAPSAEMLVRDDLIETIKTFLDVQFVDPNVAEVANVSPASITNGLTPVDPTGTNAAALRADVQTLFKSFIQANMDPTKAVWIMETTQALAISMMQNALGQPEFGGITIQGGTFFGLPVIPSMSANIAGSPDSGKMIILANADDIMIADEGGLTVEGSREASIQMADNPSGNAASGTAGTANLVSMFQTNSLALKLVRYVNWKKRRSTAVAYIKEAQYVG